MGIDSRFGILRFLRLLLCLLFLFPVLVSAKTLIFTAPPRETPDQGKAMYGPIADYLSKVLKVAVKYEHPQNWTNYTRDMRDGKYDIVFDGPHFAAWRIKHYNHKAVAKLPGSLKFVIFTGRDNNKINNLRDLIGKNICGLPSPNLATMSAFSMYNNPVIQPYVYFVKGGPPMVYKSFKKGKCVAAVIRDQFLLKKVSVDEREKIKIIAKSRPYPNQTFTVSTRLAPEQIQRIKTSLSSPEGAHAAEKLLNRFSKKRKYIEPADTRDYAGIEKLLENIVWGW
jgi:ABC-type phosphate/phosphonate transport system substrate-binding protein